MRPLKLILKPLSLAFLIFLIALQFYSAPVSAADFSVVEVPKELEPWVDWVLDPKIDLHCADSAGQRSCVWSGQLVLRVGLAGGDFSYRLTVDDVSRPTKVALPGGGKVWPVDLEIQKDGAAFSAIGPLGQHSAELLLSKGQYLIKGKFRWKKMPEKLVVPSEVALVSLRVLGKTIEQPVVAANGELWLRRTEPKSAEEDDALRVEVFRKLVDGSPFQVHTQLRLLVSGKGRELNLGQIHPAGSRPILASGSRGLGFRLDEQLNIILQLKTGTHYFNLDSVYDSPPAQMQPPKSSVQGWPTKEYWVWQSAEKLRAVELSGAATIDPSRTPLPNNWRGLPAYVLKAGTTLDFKTLARGEQEPQPNQLHLSRRVWLDEDGEGYTFQDTISGEMNSGWRLNMQAPTVLGSVRVNGGDSLITAGAENALAGVELRDRSLSVVADSRITGDARSLPAVSWDHDVKSLKMSLALPPGWDLLEQRG